MRQECRERSPRRRFQRKPLVSDPGMHHGTCVTHVSWCMSGSLTCGDGEKVPGISGACAPTILRIWQEAHYSVFKIYSFSGSNRRILRKPWRATGWHNGFAVTHQNEKNNLVPMSSGWLSYSNYVMRMTYSSILCHLDDLTEVDISSRWVTAIF